MHCPRCGQQQISNETKFCSRCGFQLGLVAELLANDGFLPQLAALYTQKRSFFSRKNGLIFTSLWFIFWMLMMPALAGIADEGEAAGAIAVFGLFTSMMMLIISLALLKKSVKPLDLRGLEKSNPAPVGIYGNTSAGALPPEQSQPASVYFAPQGAWRVPDTGDLVSPGSVTDGTTKLLAKDREAQ